MGTVVDVLDAGTGPPVVLLHSSVSGNRQWKALVADLRDRHRVLAINLLGYGGTPPWSEERPQRLTDQAALVHAVLPDADEPVALVGHSFGGAVAMRAAVELGERVSALVLLEPNPVALLARHGRADAFAEACSLRDHIQGHGAAGTWDAAAPRFADYWLGDGAWSAMPASRRAAFVAALPPNRHEWDAVTDPDLTLDDVAPTGVPTLLVHDPATRRPIHELVALLAEFRPAWRVHALEGGGHMAPLVRPDLVNPVVASFLAAP
ncbi:pimeloyl-ACP methyl ester carboxylesterase [Actinomycetospora succinea]|uniref:Pimeloyl-ACP methyl ester carboxylesterase n=1 Tax=Actinomycetospora succinea TaxID=663603 RepID=A0A4R6VIZ0_9PSEU|nr:alpha/beta hydrolase [Actinomycetospora succinea]TDQ63237.1 pimeloyl-ACP methyl ester carboxylesterase [Actinomycetospora succinea]